MRVVAAVFKNVLFISLCTYTLVMPQARALEEPRAERKPRNVIVIIGDGMGPQQIGLALAFAQRAEQRSMAAALERFLAKSVVGVHLPFPKGNLVNDSACSATMLSSGCSCSPGQLGLDENGKQAESAVSVAKKVGKRVGLISDTRITHATPAAFAVHVKHRSMESEIADQLIDQNSIDLLFSGGLAYFTPQARAAVSSLEYAKYSSTSARKDQRNLIEQAKKQGYATIFNQSTLAGLTQLPALGLFADTDMQNAFAEGSDGQPTLAAMTEKALALLENPKGFFLMVESGQIDWAGHQNDASWMLRELLRLSSVIQVIENYSRDRQDTLVILTADHETGGFGFTHDSVGSYIKDQTLDLFSKQVRPIQQTLAEFMARPTDQRTAEELKRLVEKDTGILLEDQQITNILLCIENSSSSSHCEKEPLLSDKNLSPSLMLARAVSAHLGVVWATPGHTSTPVFIFSYGPESKSFSQLQNTDKFGLMLKKIIAQ